MAAVIAVLVTVSVSLLITRVGTSALVHTGLSREVARFQARSAFFGVGFTTAEAESVVNHPVRRRIVLWLVLLGNAGIVTVLASVVLSASSADGITLGRAALLAGGLTILGLLARSRMLGRLIDAALNRWTELEVRDYADLLRLHGDFAVSELRVQPEDWLAERALGDLHLRDEGLMVLGITRAGGDWIGAPDGDTVLHAGDVLVVYGRENRLEEIDERRRDPEGDRAHAAAVAEQERLEAAEDAR